MMRCLVRITALVSLVLLFTFYTGCISPVPVQQGDTATTPVTTVPVPDITSQVTQVVTPLPAGNVPVETPLQDGAWVKRPYGYVRYVYNPDHHVRLLESHAERDSSGATVITGTIKNTGTERIGLVTVTINLFDANGNVIGSACAEEYYLEPDKVWKFRTTPYMLSDFRTYQVAEIFTG